MAFVALSGGLISLSLGVYGRVHQPTGRRMTSLFFPSLPAMKAWLGTIALALALFQILSALAMYGRLPLVKTNWPWLTFAHRWSGTAAFLVSLPVGYHCLWALGFRPAAHVNWRIRSWAVSSTACSAPSCSACIPPACPSGVYQPSVACWSLRSPDLADVFAVVLHHGQLPSALTETGREPSASPLRTKIATLALTFRNPGRASGGHLRRPH